MNAILPTEDPSIGAASEERDQYLTFRLDDETFGVGILGVKEIIEYGDMTTVPMMPAFVHGVLNLRGRVVPVVDLSLRFGRERTEIGRRTCVIIVELSRDGRAEDVGLLVDAVNQVTEIPPQNIAAPPSFSASLRTEFISGMARAEDRFVILLRIEKVLSFQELVEISATAGQLQHSVAPDA